jgi:hypothetical protein
VDALADWTRGELEKTLDSIELAVTIPVNLCIKGKQTILDLTEMEKILREAELISIGECGCRKKLRRCNAPLDVCFSLDKEAEEFVKKGLARKASLGEALDALKRSHEAGLVHITYTFKGKKKSEVICSCCSCCCHSLSALVRFGVPDVVAASKFIAALDPETCINCGKMRDKMPIQSQTTRKRPNDIRQNQMLWLWLMRKHLSNWFHFISNPNH